MQSGHQICGSYVQDCCLLVYLKPSWALYALDLPSAPLITASCQQKLLWILCSRTWKGLKLLGMKKTASCVDFTPQAVFSFCSLRWRRTECHLKLQNMNGLDVAVSVLLSLCFQSDNTICWKLYGASQGSARNKSFA